MLNRTFLEGIFASQDKNRILIDFGLNAYKTFYDPAYGYYWNNSNEVQSYINDVVFTNNTSSGINMAPNSLSVSYNDPGGLITPGNCLSYFAVTSATRDYHFLFAAPPQLSSSYGFFNLNNKIKYNFRMFGSRDIGIVRKTRYYISDSNGTPLPQYSFADIQTSGLGAGSTGSGLFNDCNIVSINNIAPDSGGNIYLTLSALEPASPFAYLNILEITF